MARKQQLQGRGRRGIAVLLTGGLLAVGGGNLLSGQIKTQQSLLGINYSWTEQGQAQDALYLDLAAFKRGEVPAQHLANPACQQPQPALACFQQREQLQATENYSTSKGRLTDGAQLHQEVQVTSASGQNLFSAKLAADVNRQNLTRMPQGELTYELSTALGTAQFSDVTPGSVFSFPRATEYRSYQLWNSYTGTAGYVDYYRSRRAGAVTWMSYRQPEQVVRLGQGVAQAEQDQPQPFQVRVPAGRAYTPAELEQLHLAADQEVTLSMFAQLSSQFEVALFTGKVGAAERKMQVILAQSEDEARASFAALQQQADAPAAGRLALQADFVTPVAVATDTAAQATQVTATQMKKQLAARVLVVLGLMLLVAGLGWWWHRRQNQTAG